VGVQFALLVLCLWAPVPPPCSRYAANLFGQVMGPNGHVLRPYKSEVKSRYANLSCTYDSGKVRTVGVHRLVCAAWTLGVVFWSRSVDHADGNRCNNTVPNLRWATATEQAANRVLLPAFLRRATQVRRTHVITVGRVMPACAASANDLFDAGARGRAARRVWRLHRALPGPRGGRQGDRRLAFRHQGRRRRQAHAQGLPLGPGDRIRAAALHPDGGRVQGRSGPGSKRARLPAPCRGRACSAVCKPPTACV